jgi:transcription termination/antitermination protein NusA
MFDIKQFLMAVEQLAAEKNIPKDRIQETVEFAIAAAYKKENDLQGCKVKATLDPETGKSKIWQELTVVDEKTLEEEEKKFNPKKQVMLEDAKKKKKTAKVGDIIKISLLKNKDNYGRIATQTAKQVIIQKIKEVERDLTFSEYKEKEGEAISGIVQRQEKGTIFLDIGRTNGILPPQEQIPNEHYNSGQRLRVLLLSVREESRGPVIFLSRKRVEFLFKLLELEVPEITNNDVEIKAIAREAGKRSKIAVTSEEEGIDPIGACVGQQGTRISAVINELNGENIDIVLWSSDTNKFISNALSPAKVLDVKLNEKNKEATVIVASDQLSLAIGKEGQNVRLAAKLTGWKIDVTTNEKQEEKTKQEPKEKSKKTSKKKVEQNKASSKKKSKK